nr:MAG TPA: hypothetical protein [Caudoviricetes sp.]
MFVGISLRCPSRDWSFISCCLMSSQISLASFT